MLEVVRFWSERQVRRVWFFDDGERDAWRSLGVACRLSIDGELGKRSWNGCFILRTERKGEMQTGARSTGRFGCAVVYST